MYINDRDEINYHGFLRATRERQNVSLRMVGEGICTESAISRVEIGDRLPEKLMRDRISARLGVSGEGYEEYLRYEEYRQWKIRMNILECLDNGDIEGARKAIELYEQIPNKNPVQEQFVVTMYYMLERLIGRWSRTTLAMLVNLAIVHTIPSISMAFAGAHLLADQELNLIAEYTQLCDYEGDEDEVRWRLGEYKKILEYVDHSAMDKLSQAKIYPKVTCMLCELLLQTEATDEELYYALEMCDRSIELLRDTSRLYYMVELLEHRKGLIKHVMDIPELSVEELIRLQGIYDKDTDWEETLKELYQEYNLPIYMQNFTYLYVETECHDVVAVIRARRNMFRLSRKKISAHVCTEKTIQRMETYENSPSMAIVRDVFDKMGLCAEYKRARVITDNAEMLELSNQLVYHINNGNEAESWECINRLEEGLPMKFSFNKQEIQKQRNLLKLRSGNYDEKLLYKEVMRTLECTIPFGCIIRNTEKYLTREELECIYDLAFKVDGEASAWCYNYLKEYCDKAIMEESNIRNLCVYEPLMTEIASVLGDCGQYTESLRYSEWLVKECLRHKRSAALVDNVYNKNWVMDKLSIESFVDIDRFVVKKLSCCIRLAELNKRTNWLTFLLPS